MEEELEIFRLLEQLTKEREEFIRTRQQFLPRNVPVKRKEFQNNKAVKSDLKKSNAFVKKIKSINTEGIQQCIRDTDTLNLTLYISEIVSAILATTYKATDVSHMVKLCLSLHTKYDEFTEPLITGLKTTLLAGQGGAVSEDAAAGEGGSAGEVGKKRRIQIRFAIELYQAGLFNDDEFFLNLLRQLLGKASAISSSKGAAATPATVSASSGKGGGMIDLQGLSTFVKYGSEILFGFIPRKLLDLGKKVGKPANELPVKILASAKNSTEMRTLLLDTYQMISNDLIEAHKQYRIKEHKFEKDRLIHGSLSEQKQQELENSKKLYEKLLSVITTLSECTGENIPELKIEKFEEEGGGGITVWEGNSGNNAADDAAGNAGLFEDSETRAFYEDLPDLLSLVPLSILGFSHEQAAALQEEWAAKEKQTSEEDNENILPEQMSKMEQEIEAVGIQDDGNDDLAEIENDNDATDEGKSEAGGLGGISSKSNTSLTSLAVDESGSSSTNAAKLQELLSVKILECNTKQKADDFTVSFCYISNNSKAARKRLAQVIAKIPRQRADLAPFYGRIIASLHRLYSDILPIVIELLRKEFYGIIKTKKQTFNIDHKVKNIRLTCELMKFRIIPPIIIFRMYKTLLYDLSPHHIELLAVGLETCGRFLYQLRYTRETMEEILDTMMRLRYAKRIDLYQQTVLESAYFAVKPPEKQPAAARKKERSLLEQYVRYLILDTLDTADASTSAEMTVDVTIKALRRLPWNQIKEIPLDVYITKAAMKLARYKYTSIPNLADCLSGIAKHYPNVLTRLLDTCLEEIQRAIEIPYKRDIQRIIGYTKLIGELYNFTAIPSTLIFDLLFHLIHYGHFNLQQYLADHPAGVNNTSDNVHSAGTVFIPGQHFIPAGLTHTTLPFTSTIFMKYYDPKTIITEMDLPNDLFRTQIICELLNTCGIYYVRGHLKEKLNKFFIYFQRYLLTKQLIPLHIEFSILDTFDYLEELAREAYIEDQQTAVNAAAAAAAAAANAGITSPQVAKKGRGNFTAPGTLPVEPVIAPISFPRYDNYDEVQKIIDVFEKNTSNSTNNNTNQTQKDEDEEEMLLDRREKKNSKQNDDEGKKAVTEKKNSEDVDDGDEEGDEDEEDDGDDDEDDDDEDEDGDDSDEESSDDDSEADDDDDDDDDSSDAAEEDEIDDEEEEEEAAKLLEKLRIVEEDEEFEKAFKSVVQESMNSVSVKHQDVNKMVIPAVLPKPKNNAPAAEDDQPTVTASHHHQQHHHHHHHSAPAAPAMKFSLLSRDNKGRVEARQLLVPKDNPMAVKLAKAEEEARLEKLRIKERTLQLNSLNNDDYDFDDLPDSSKYMGYGNTSTNVTTSTKSSGGGGAANSAVSATATAGSGVSERSSSNSSSKSDRIVTNAGIMNRKPKYHNVVRAEEVRKAPDTLNLDEFLAEANAAEIRRITSRKNN